MLTDDLSSNLVSYMPHLQAVQRAGTTMSSYYVVDSLCCPSRSAIFTGQFPHDDGVFTNAGRDGGYFAFNQHDDQQKSFALALHDAGYRTAMMGKYLNQYQPSYPEPPGWDEWDVAGNAYGEFGYNLNQNGRQQHYGSAPQDYLTDVLAAKANAFIGSSAASGQPFMLEVATFAPHAPYTPAPRYAHAAQQLTYPKNPAYDRLPANPPPWLKGHPPLSALDQHNITTTFRERVEDDLSVDDMIGQIENELRATGLDRNTYFVFSSDNGFHMGEYTPLLGQADRLRHRHPGAADRDRPWRPGGPRRQPAGVQHRPGSDLRDPRGPARPGRRRRSQPGGAVARAGSGRLAARRPRRAPRPGFLAGRSGPADLQTGRPAEL